METKKMPATVLENIKGREFPTGLRKKLNVLPDELYIIKVQPQKEYTSFLKVVSKIRDRAEKKGMTDEILADALGIESVI